MERKLLVESAQSWYESAHDPSYTMAERLLFMENALNHTENKLSNYMNANSKLIINPDNV